MFSEHAIREAIKADHDEEYFEVVSGDWTGDGCPEPEAIVGLALGDDVMKEDIALWQHVLMCDRCAGEIRALGLAADELRLGM